MKKFFFFFIISFFQLKLLYKLDTHKCLLILFPFSGFAVPVAIIPEQYLPVVESASVVVPVAVDCTVCPPKESDIIGYLCY